MKIDFRRTGILISGYAAGIAVMLSDLLLFGVLVAFITMAVLKSSIILGLVGIATVAFIFFAWKREGGLLVWMEWNQFINNWKELQGYND